MEKKPAKTVIKINRLQKSYGKLKVLKGVSFEVKAGDIVALLGPNGAGKTTMVKIMSTLLKADGGTVTIGGHNVAEDPQAVREIIGLTGQFAAVDEYLSGEENLIMMGRLYRLSKKDSKKRAKELLKEFDLEEAGKRTVKTYSGGMKRRIDLAMSLIALPPVIFLDEPTTGLDPRSRMTMWETIKRLAKDGTTILLTTQYMEEADMLANNIVVIDGGKVIAEGTADQLKNKIGNERIEFGFKTPKDTVAAAAILNADPNAEGDEPNSISISNDGGVKKLRSLLEKFESSKVKVESLSLHKPTLDDVFLKLTGHAATKEETNGEKANGKGKK